VQLSPADFAALTQNHPSIKPNWSQFGASLTLSDQAYAVTILERIPYLPTYLLIRCKRWPVFCYYDTSRRRICVWPGRPGEAMYIVDGGH